MSELDADPLGRTRAVRGRLLDAARRGERGAVRHAQPRPADRRRSRARGGEPPPAVRGGRHRPGAPLLRQAGARRGTSGGQAAPGEPGDGLWTDTPGRAAARLHRRLPAGRDRAVERRAGPRWRRSTSAGAACSPGSSRAPSQRSAAARSPPRSAPGSARAATRSGRRSPAPFRERFGEEIVRDGRLDLWTAAERALRAAGVGDVHRTDLCTSCNPELFFSHRRDAGRTGRQGMIAYVS